MPVVTRETASVIATADLHRGHARSGRDTCSCWSTATRASQQQQQAFLLACRLAGTDCKNRQLPKILILV